MTLDIMKIINIILKLTHSSVAQPVERVAVNPPEADSSPSGTGGKWEPQNILFTF